VRVRACVPNSSGLRRGSGEAQLPDGVDGGRTALGFLRRKRRPGQVRAEAPMAMATAGWLGEGKEETVADAVGPTAPQRGGGGVGHAS
jgi:hypothetical protein